MENISRLSTTGTAAALAASLVAAFVLCAIAQVVLPGAQFTHMWLQLFTAAPLGSLNAWIEGILASVVFGLVLGYCFAHCYNWAAGRK